MENKDLCRILFCQFKRRNIYSPLQNSPVYACWCPLPSKLSQTVFMLWVVKCGKRHGRCYNKLYSQRLLGAGVKNSHGRNVPGFDSLNWRHNMWVELEGGSRPCPVGFNPDTLVFLLTEITQNFQIQFALENSVQTQNGRRVRDTANPSQKGKR